VKLVLVASLVTALAFAGARVSILRLALARVAGRTGVRHLQLTGTEFLLAGLVLSSGGLDVLDDAVLAGLTPILGLGLSWIGLLFGIQWEIRRLDVATRAGLWPALLQAGIVMAVVAAPLAALLRWRFEASGALVLVAAATLGAAASDTAHGPSATLARDVGGRRRGLLRLLRLIADVDGLVAVAVFGAVCWLPALHGGAGSPAAWAALSLGLGVVVGLIVVALTAYRVDEEERLLILLGAILGGGGAALSLSLSPLFVNAVAGAVVANLAGPRTLRSLRSLLVRGDRAVYVLFLILVGARWHPTVPAVIGLAVVYWVLRTAGKQLGAWLAFRRSLAHLDAGAGGVGGPGVARRLGLGLLAHGGLAVAVVVNLQLVLGRSPLVDAVTTIVLLGVVVSELTSPALARGLLRRGGVGAAP
jgi:hypothetical protein